jgi:hypothetical protein
MATECFTITVFFLKKNGWLFFWKIIVLRVCEN